MCSILIGLLPHIYSSVHQTSVHSIPNVTFSSFPARLQFYPRDISDSAEVKFAGSMNTTGYDSLIIRVFRNNVLWKNLSVKLNYIGSAASFVVSPKIHAELTEFKFVLYAKNNMTLDSVASRDSIICGDVYLINGQSNSHPINPSANYRNEFCRSFGKNTDINIYNPADTLWGLARGEDAVNFHTGVWGIKLQQYIVDTYGIPVCILNGGSGGSRIEHNLRNNSNHEDLTTTYGRLLYRVRKAGLQNSIKAMMWYQGESNTDSSYYNYINYFTQLRSAWFENFPGMNKIYVFQVRMGCVQTLRIYQTQLRENIRKLKDYFPELELMSTVGVQGHDGCHYNFNGYNETALNIFRLISRDFYHGTDTIDIEPPNIKSAAFITPERDRLRLIFEGSSNLVWPADTLGRSLYSYFYFDTVTYGVVSSHLISGDTLILNLTGTVNAGNISYLPNIYYNGTSTVYQGPWLRNSKRVGALSFYRFPISAFVSVEPETVVPSDFYLSQNYPNPFNPETVISFGLPEKNEAEINIYDINGKLISRLIKGVFGPGNYKVKWNAEGYSSGIYFYVLSVAGKKQTKKMIVVK